MLWIITLICFTADTGYNKKDEQNFAAGCSRGDGE